MTTPHEKATRHRPAERVRRPEPVMDVLLSAVAIGLGLVLPLVRGSALPAVVGTFVVGAALPVLGYLLPPRPRWVLLLVAAFAGVFLLSALASDTYLLYAWFMSLLLGAIVLLRLLYRRQQRPAHLCVCTPRRGFGVVVDLAPGVTRYHLQGYRYRRQGAGDLIVAGLLLVGGLAFALWGFDTDPTTVLVIAPVCVLVPAPTIVFPWPVRVLIIAAANIAVLSWANGTGHLGRGYAIAWFVSAVAGMAPLMALAYRRYRRQRVDRAEGAPPANLDPSNGKDVGLLALWRDAQYDYEAAQPSLDVVLEAVRALNGADRTFVSIFNGPGRMDVGGDARGRLVVLQSDNRSIWHMVETPHEPEAKEPIVVAGVRTQYPRRKMTTLPAAERAVTAWLLHGERDPGLDWWDDSGLDQAFRPRPLTLND